VVDSGITNGWVEIGVQLVCNCLLLTLLSCRSLSLSASEWGGASYRGYTNGSNSSLLLNGNERGIVQALLETLLVVQTLLEALLIVQTLLETLLVVQTLLEALLVVQALVETLVVKTLVQALLVCPVEVSVPVIEWQSSFVGINATVEVGPSILIAKTPVASA